MSAQALEYQTFSEFHDVLKALVSPERLAERLIPYFRDQVGNGLSDVQALVPALRLMNVTFIEKGDVTEFCGASIFQGPAEMVTQVFAYQPGSDCKKHYYKRVSTADMDCWQERQRCALCAVTDPPSTAIYDSPYCNYVVGGDAACTLPYLTPPEDTCRFRSLGDDDRIYAVGPDNKIFLAPRFPCGYVVCIQSQGIRRKWNNNDQVLIDQQMREAVYNYVEAKIAKKEKDHIAKAVYENDYITSIRMLRKRFFDEQDVTFKRDCSAAITQMMASSFPLYETAVWGPFGLPFPGGVTQGDDTVQVYTGTAPPAAPEDPTKGAFFYYFEGYGTGILTWSVTNQIWLY